MKPLALLATGMFTMGCSSYVVAGLLPGISATLATSVAAAGQGISAFGLTYVIGAPVFAVLLARQPAKRILVLALSIFALGNILTLLSTNLLAYLCSRALTGIGAGLYTPIAVSAAIQLVAPTARGRALSVMWGANSAGAVLGVPTGLWLAARSGWQSTLGVIAALAAVSLAAIALRPLALQVNAPPTLSARIRMLVDRRVLGVVGVTCLTATASLGLYSYVAPMLSESAHTLASALFVWSLGGLIGSTTIGHLIDRTGRPRLVMAGVLAVLTAAILAVPHVRSIPVLGLLPILIWGAAGWATVTPQQHTLLSLQPAQGSTVVALNASALSLGGVLGTAVGGLAISNGLGAENLPYAAAGLLLVAFLTQLTLLNPTPKEVAA